MWLNRAAYFTPVESSAPLEWVIMRTYVYNIKCKFRPQISNLDACHATFNTLFSQQFQSNQIYQFLAPEGAATTRH